MNLHEDMKKNRTNQAETLVALVHSFGHFSPTVSGCIWMLSVVQYNSQTRGPQQGDLWRPIHLFPVETTSTEEEFLVKMYNPQEEAEN